MRKHTGIAAFSDLRTPSSDGVRDAITVRPSASANFFVDSVDKVEGQSSTDFTINKSQSLFNGFFNRIAVAEVVLDWGVPNIATYWGNSVIKIGNATTLATFTLTLTDGFFTPVSLLFSIAQKLNDAAIAAGDPLRLQVTTFFGGVVLRSVGVGTDPFAIFSNTGVPMNTNLPRQIFTSAELDIAAVNHFIESPLLLGTRYIDIVCQQLTYNQDLKDNTTSNNNRDVLYRWYFTYDNVPVAYDQIIQQIDPGQVGPPVYPPTYALANTDLPIIEGYTSFVSRRTPPVPKQVRWSPEQPVGQVNFQVYDDQGRLLQLNDTTFPTGYNFQFQMSMLLSED